jgi:hypothetical protein
MPDPLPLTICTARAKRHAERIGFEGALARTHM